MSDYARRIVQAPGPMSIEQPQGSVAIIDYGLGNLFSVRNACLASGLNAVMTRDKRALSEAACVILPGVGAFADAIDALRSLDLIAPLKDYVQSGKPLVGICLGMQLLLSE